VQKLIQSLEDYIMYLTMKVFEELSFLLIRYHPHHHQNMLPKVSLEGDLKAQTFFLWVVYLLSVENLWVELFRKLELAQ
jgi:hypothetical protein